MAAAAADVQGVEKETPLMIAAADGLTDNLECLVQARADPNPLDCLGQTPLEIAARFSSRKDVEILFPVTSPIVGVSDWSVDGIIDYMKSVPLAKVDDVHNARLAGGKFQGREAVKNKDYLAATIIYTEAMDLDPDDATLFSNRSLCWFHLSEGKKALLDAQACRAMRSGWAEAFYREGAALMLLKVGSNGRIITYVFSMTNGFPY
ncbi:tetratricopeptide repeat protein 28 [Setaria italica]|uniref:tetratricopeptide repeat protein 28 n=1 Tax=Setaria italica TaxID=4555 RepID=UPI000646BD30|nr:tetratricopeptide repeat protein 28 [Setaria italica]